MPTDFFSQEEFQPWTLAQIYADLGSSSDITLALNIRPRRFTNWIQRREELGCPKPIRKFGPTPVYSIQEWRDWYAKFLDKNKWLDGFCGEHPKSPNEQARRFFGEG